MPPVTLSTLIDDVVARAPSGQPLDLLATASATAADLDEASDALVSHFVDRCRRAGLSWSEIGGSLGVTKQAVQKRFTPPDDREPDGWSRYTPRAKRVVSDHAPAASRMLGHGWTGTEHLLLGLFGEPEGLAAVALQRQGVTGEAAVVAVRERLGVGAAPDGGPFTPRAWRAREGV
jgi:hypothetical protein